MAAGPYCGKLLAALGAEVVKAEPLAGDRARREGPFAGGSPHPEKSCLYLYVNAGKLGITLNLESPRGRRIFEQLTESADVLVEDTPPGTLDALGLGYSRLSRINRRLVVTSITPFGQTGPYRDYKAYHINTYHSGGDGNLLQSGAESLALPPMTGGGHMGDFEAGGSAALATVAALFASQVTGQGQQVDVSKQETLLALNRDIVARIASGEKSETRLTRKYPYGGMMPCKDGYIVIAVTENNHWQALMTIMGKLHLADDPRFETHESRCRHGGEVNQHITEWSMRHTKSEIYRSALDIGCPIGYVTTPEEVVASPQSAARGLFKEIQHPVAGTGHYAALPFTLAGGAGRPSQPAPLLGEHNQLVLSERLGYPQDEMEQLRRDGTI
jgi:crotonobetainyl-CoA:carnitine CoA-transferase CaiB-like acyl-CoA transferase